MANQSHAIEIACFSKEAALIAAEAGAHRLELCANKELGGVSPNLEWVKEIKSKVAIPVYVMVRPRGGNFIYTDEEVLEMENYMLAAHSLKVDGFVFGCLDDKQHLNPIQNERLIKAANHKPCTLHRAFDETIDPFETLNSAINLGFKTILSSGCKTEASQGLSILSKLFIKSYDKIHIMPGGNIRSSNLANIKKHCGAFWYHSAAITDKGILPNAAEIKALLNI